MNYASNQTNHKKHMHKFLISTALCGLGVIGATVTSCVQDEYDLSEDIDLTISAGGNITLPSSSTDALTMGQILDLNDNSAIKTVTADGQYGLKAGDYVLVQGGASSPATFDVPTVEIYDVRGSSNNISLPRVTVPAGVTGRITVPVSTFRHNIDFAKDDVTREILSIAAADVSVDVRFQLSLTADGYNGNVYINNGFKLDFDDSWTCEVADAATAAFLEMKDGHTAVFKEDYAVANGRGVTIAIRVKHIDFKSGQGLTSPGHFRLNSMLNCGGNLSANVAGTSADGVQISLTSQVSVSHARLEAVRGTFDPAINVSATTFTINDVPDFLKNDANNLDVDNPRISFTATNTSPLPIELNGKLIAFAKGAVTATVGIGADYGTDPVRIAADGTCNIVISRRPVAGSGFTNIVVPTLGELIRTVPDQISFTDIKAAAVRDVITFPLGRTFTFDAAYEAIIPLSFGRDMLLQYSDDKTDLGDLGDYNFKEAEATLTAVSTIPLSMEPKLIALDADGNELTDITATVEGVVQPGSVENPVTSTVKVRLKSTAQSLGRMFGIRYVFNAKAGDMIGVALNANQTIRFTDIRIKLIGGVQIDLND